MGALKEELLRPISPQAFCGEDAGYEPEFEAAKAEMEKLSGNDFTSIENNCRKLLLEKSKDMRTLGFFCLAAGLTRGVAAFGDAVSAYAELVQSQWDNIHPARLAGRANALRWLNGDRVLSLLRTLQPDTSAHAELAAAAEGMQALRRLSEEKWLDNTPSFGSFTKIVEELAAQSRPREEPKYEEPAYATTSGSAPGGPESASGGPASAPAPALESVSDAETLIQKSAQLLLREKPSHPLGYRLMRMLRWDAINQLPPNEGGATPIPPPDAELAEVFANLFQSRDWNHLSQGAENAFSRDDMLMWLDLQRYICTALAGLGGEYTACSDAIIVELGLLLKRLPGLAGLQFEGGRPFADPLTRDWINDTVKKALGGGGGSGGPKLKGDIAKESEQAAKMVGEGKLQEALALLQTGLANDSTARNGFQRKLLMAELCYKSQKFQMALALLEELRKAVERFALEEWEPELCVSLYALAYKARQALSGEAGEVEKDRLRAANSLDFSRLSRLDPLQALELDFQ